MTLKGGTSQACAACKYQRRKCTSECVLAPYFPPDQPKMFQNAHRLFGVRNISKILEELDPTQRTEAMRSIIYQANMRDRFPVHGCLGVILQYQYQIRQLEDELHAVLAQLAFYQQQEMSAVAPNDTSQLQLQLGMPPPINAHALFGQEISDQQQYDSVNALPIASHPSYNSFCGNVSADYIDSKDNNLVNSFWIQQSCSNGGNNSNDQIQMMASQADQLIESQNMQQEIIQDYEFFDAINDRQSFIDTKENQESSSESSLIDTTQSLERVAENELKNAAACFTLTSVN
ncbi:LOB domain-containing protein [Heracleum sosnowskyi]|uniref:LOB domain-containing protein n=1 Tax=Heracleum sosnowskyi TaxID=360622 RepID=A0AAD8HTS3_9APIA|nr:LOB domain-containing protein [Heracleum sosnowskyi]